MIDCDEYLPKENAILKILYYSFTTYFSQVKDNAISKVYAWMKKICEHTSVPQTSTLMLTDIIKSCSLLLDDKNKPFVVTKEN